jgi:hypothetical protein
MFFLPSREAAYIHFLLQSPFNKKPITQRRATDGATFFI